jgi:hypothetical protein
MNAGLMSKADVAKFLGLSIVSIDRLRKKGLLPFRQISGLIRFTEKDLNTFVERAARDGEAHV